MKSSDMESPHREQLRARRVLVTGASGFIGRWVARALSEAGAQLWLTARDRGSLCAVAEAYGIRGEIAPADLAKPHSFAGLYERIRPEVTFNLAGYGVDPKERDEAEACRLNVDLVREIAETIAQSKSPDWHGLHFVHVGSTAEYGPVNEVQTEGTAPRPTSLYGRTKLDGSRVLRDVAARTGLRGITARLFTVYGPGEHAGRLLPSLLEAARSGGNLALTSGEQQRDFTFVRDVADGLLRLACGVGPAPGIVNVATGRLTAVRDFVLQAAGILGIRPQQLDFGAVPLRRDDFKQGPADMAQLFRLTNWLPGTCISDGVRWTLEFETTLKPGRM